MFESSGTILILLAIVGVGGVLSGMAWRMAARRDRRITEDKRAADADCCAFQRAMDDFRIEMQGSPGGNPTSEGRSDAAG